MRVFGLLKGHWRASLKKIEQHHVSVARTVTAACILQNVRIVQGDAFDEDKNRLAPDDEGDDDEAQDGTSTRQCARFFSCPGTFVIFVIYQIPSATK